MLFSNGIEYDGKYHQLENFKYLYDLCEANMKEIADITGIPLSHLYRFLNGEDEIRIYDLFAFKDLFNVSIDDFLMVSLKDKAGSHKKYNPFLWAGSYRVKIYDKYHKRS